MCTQCPTNSEIAKQEKFLVYTYRIVSYYVHPVCLLHPLHPSKGIPELKAQGKEYNYIYTGKNKDILDFPNSPIKVLSHPLQQIEVPNSPQTTGAAGTQTTGGSEAQYVTNEAGNGLPAGEGAQTSRCLNTNTGNAGGSDLIIPQLVLQECPMIDL